MKMVRITESKWSSKFPSGTPFTLTLIGPSLRTVDYVILQLQGLVMLITIVSANLGSFKFLWLRFQCPFVAVPALSVGGPAPRPPFSRPKSTRIISSPKRDPHWPIATVGIYILQYTPWAAFVCKPIPPAVFCCLGTIYVACLSPFFKRMLGASYGRAMVQHRQKTQERGKAKENPIHAMVHLEPS